MTSTYPLPVDELTDRLREYAARIGEWPSRRQVMSEFRVGRPKAAAALDALRDAGFNPAPDATESAPVPAGLHIVPNPAPETADPVPAEDRTEDQPADTGGPADTPAESEHGDHDAPSTPPRRPTCPPSICPQRSKSPRRSVGPWTRRARSGRGRWC